MARARDDYGCSPNQNNQIPLRSQRQARRNLRYRGNPNDDGDSDGGRLGPGSRVSRRSNNQRNRPQTDVRIYQQEYPVLANARGRGDQNDNNRRDYDGSSPRRFNAGIGMNRQYVEPIRAPRPIVDTIQYVIRGDIRLWSRFGHWIGRNDDPMIDEVEQARNQIYRDRNYQGSNCHGCSHPVYGIGFYHSIKFCPWQGYKPMDYINMCILTMIYQRGVSVPQLLTAWCQQLKKELPMFQALWMEKQYFRLINGDYDRNLNQSVRAVVYGTCAAISRCIQGFEWWAIRNRGVNCFGNLKYDNIAVNLRAKSWVKKWVEAAHAMLDYRKFVMAYQIGNHPILNRVVKLTLEGESSSVHNASLSEMVQSGFWSANKPKPSESHIIEAAAYYEFLAILKLGNRYAQPCKWTWATGNRHHLLNPPGNRRSPMYLNFWCNHNNLNAKPVIEDIDGPKRICHVAQFNPLTMQYDWIDFRQWNSEFNDYKHYLQRLAEAQAEEEARQARYEQEARDNKENDQDEEEEKEEAQPEEEVDSNPESQEPLTDEDIMKETPGDDTIAPWVHKSQAKLDANK
eukprot:156705_1